jgi:hypothetical protein
MAGIALSALACSFVESVELRCLAERLDAPSRRLA